jgi:hypothetical protein
MRKYLKKSYSFFDWLAICLIKHNHKPKKRINMKNYLHNTIDFFNLRIANNAWWVFGLLFLEVGLFLFIGVYALEGFEHPLDSAIIAAIFSLEIVGIFRLYVWLSNKMD